MRPGFDTKRIRLLTILLLLLVGFLSQNSLLAEQRFVLSKHADFSTDDRVFTREDILYMKVIATDIDYTDLDKNEWRLKPDDGGNDFEARFKNNLDGTYTASLNLSSADLSESNWEWRARVEDDGDSKFETRVHLKILGGDDDENEAVEIKGLIQSQGSNFIVIEGTTIFTNEMTQVFDINNRPLSLTELNIGDLVEVKAVRDESANWVALRIKLEDGLNEDSDEVELKGQISGKTDTTLTVQNRIFHVDSNTEVLDDDNNQISFIDLQIGQFVEIKGRFKADGGLLAIRVRLEDPNENEIEFTGLINSLSSHSITVDGFLFTVTNTTEILDDDNSPITFSDLMVGLAVEIRGILENDTLRATRIKIEDRDFGDDELEVKAVVTAVGTNFLSTSDFTFVVDALTIILDDNNSPISLSDIKVGFVVEVRAEVQPDGSLLATKIKVEDFFEDEVELTGAIVSIEDSSLVVSGLEFFISDSTEIFDNDDNRIAFSHLKVGDVVEIRAVVQVNGSLVATAIKLEDRFEDEVEVVGTIGSLGADSLVVSRITFFVDANTLVFDNQQNPISFNELMVGQIVEVRGELLPDGRLLATKIKIEDSIEDEVEITGKIDSLSENSITVLDRTFGVTENTVVFDDNNDLISFNELSVGLTIEIRGDLLPDGTLIAIRLKIEDQSNNEIEVTGAIEAIDVSNLQVLGVVFQIDNLTTVVDKNNIALAFESLMPGQTVEIKAIQQADGSNLATKIKLEDLLLLTGKVQQVVSNGLELAGKQIFLDSDTIILGKFNVVLSIDDLAAGQIVEVNATLFNGDDIFATKVKVQNTDFVSSVNTKPSNRQAIPEEFVLNQNYPNPFNPSTTISFSIQGLVDGATKTKLTIFNLLGQAVRVLVNEPLAAGNYQMEWDSRDAAGNLAASGVYIYQLKVGETTQNRRMMLIK